MHVNENRIHLLNMNQFNPDFSQRLRAKAGLFRTSCQFITGLTSRDEQPSTLTFTPTGHLE